MHLVDTVAYVNLRTKRDGQALRLVRYQGGEESVEGTRYRLVL